jgi:hypothetical protein
MDLCIFQLRALSDSLTPTLQAIRQREFYTDPRFHASIAWALLDRGASKANSREQIGDMTVSSSESTRAPSPGASWSPESGHEKDFPTIFHLPHDLVPTLNDRHSAALSSRTTSAFDVNALTMKIGKDVWTWRLSG